MDVVTREMTHSGIIRIVDPANVRTLVSVSAGDENQRGVREEGTMRYFCTLPDVTPACFAGASEKLRGRGGEAGHCGRGATDSGGG